MSFFELKKGKHNENNNNNNNTNTDVPKSNMSDNPGNSQQVKTRLVWVLKKTWKINIEVIQIEDLVGNGTLFENDARLKSVT